MNDMNMYNALSIYAKADRALRMVVAKALEAYNVSMMQWLLLTSVDRAGSAGVRMSELAEELGVTMPQVTALMNDLTKKKLVKQKINSKDRRSRRLQLTAFGKTQLDSMHPAVEKTVGDWLSQVNIDKRAGFFATLEAIAALER